MVAKRKNISFKEMATCMSHARYLPSKIWAKTLNYDKYIHNRSPHIFFKENTRFEAWSNNKPEVTHFPIFGSRVWATCPLKIGKH
jgi:hypothetical protein